MELSTQSSKLNWPNILRNGGGHLAKRCVYFQSYQCVKVWHAQRYKYLSCGVTWAIFRLIGATCFQWREIQILGRPSEGELRIAVAQSSLQDCFQIMLFSAERCQKKIKGDWLPCVRLSSLTESYVGAGMRWKLSFEMICLCVSSVTWLLFIFTSPR